MGELLNIEPNGISKKENDALKNILLGFFDSVSLRGKLIILGLARCVASDDIPLIPLSHYLPQGRVKQLRLKKEKEFEEKEEKFRKEREKEAERTRLGRIEWSRDHIQWCKGRIASYENILKNPVHHKTGQPLKVKTVSNYRSELNSWHRWLKQSIQEYNSLIPKNQIMA